MLPSVPRTNRLSAIPIHIPVPAGVAIAEWPPSCPLSRPGSRGCFAWFDQFTPATPVGPLVSMDWCPSAPVTSRLVTFDYRSFSNFELPLRAVDRGDPVCYLLPVIHKPLV
jgi:hypothetical protein